MSRRHHGNRPHRSSGPPRPTDPVRSGLDAPATAANVGELASRPAPIAEPGTGVAPYPRDDNEAVRPEPARPAGVVPDHRSSDRPTAALIGGPPATIDGATTAERDQADRAMTDRSPTDRPANGHPPGPNAPGPRPDSAFPATIPGCTAPQLRRFIKSRPYVPMHELRRRFGINGSEDDVSSIELGDRRRVYVGLPPREGSLLGELLRGGDIGFELSLDPRTPIVIGLYPMRPVGALLTTSFGPASSSARRACRNNPDRRKTERELSVDTTHRRHLDTERVGCDR